MDSMEQQRVFVNARRLLAARSKAAAVALLDAAPFVIFPATNHFNDDFHVLRAEVALSDYEKFRHNERQLRVAAADLAEAIQEVDGPYIRVVAVKLRLVGPEEWEVFLSHASEDKERIARPVYAHLAAQGVRCWFDEAEIAWGDNIVAKVQEGLGLASFVVVVLSQHFIDKPWPHKELRTALSLEIEGRRSLVLPLLAGDPAELLVHLPFLREKRYLVWTGDPGAIERELKTLLRRAPVPPQ